MSHQSLPFDLLNGEKIISEGKMHWSWILPTLFKATLISAIFAGLAYVAPSYFLGTATGKIVTLVFVLCVLGYVIGVRRKHHLTRFIITNYRLINIDRHRLLHSEVREIPYDHIQSVRTLTSGFFGTIFRYGTLIINTAGEESQLEIGHHLAHPGEVQSTILATRDEFLRNLSAYNTIVDQSGMPANQSANNNPNNNPFVNFFKAMQMTQLSPVEESKPLVDFSVSDKGEDSDGDNGQTDSSSLVSMLARGGGFKKNVIQSLSQELENGGRPRGHRLVKTITSSPYFKKKVIDDLGKDILN